jgi:hypothetical protein
VKWDYDKGIVLDIKADGHLDLDVAVMDDFRSGKPGSAAVKDLMDYYGIFLRDPDRSYEEQALTSIRSSVKQKEDRYKTFAGNLRKNRAREGISENPEALEEILNESGYGKMGREVEALKARAQFLGKAVEEQQATVTLDFDPKTTLMFTNPPRQFDSEIAMRMFLNENSELREQHEEWLAVNELDG